jgi:hypothetical protein
VTPTQALKHILTLVEASAELKDDTQRKVLLRGVVVVAQKGLGVAPDGVAECEPNVPDVPYGVGDITAERTRLPNGFFPASEWNASMSAASALP